MVMCTIIMVLIQKLEASIYQIQQIQGSFNDYEQIIQNQINQTSQKAQINFSVKSQRNMVKLKEKTTLPAMCSLQTSGEEKSSVNLICVIDVSGSMCGQKIELVRQTMKVLASLLTESDRLSIIIFNNYGKEFVDWHVHLKKIYLILFLQQQNYTQVEATTSQMQ